MFVSDPQNCGEFIKNRENSRKPTAANLNIPKQKQQTPPNVANSLGKDNKKNQPLKRQEAAIKPNKSSNTNSGLRRPPKQNTGQKLNVESRLQPKLDKPKRSLNVQQDVSEKINLLLFRVEDNEFLCLTYVFVVLLETEAAR